MHTKHINRDKKEKGKNQVTLALLWTNFSSYTTTNDIKEQKINYFFGNNSKDYRDSYDSRHNEISSICFHSWNLFNQNTYEKCKINKKRSPKKKRKGKSIKQSYIANERKQSTSSFKFSG